MKRRGFFGFIFGGAVTAHQVAVNPALLANLMPAAQTPYIPPLASLTEMVAITDCVTIRDLVSANNALLIHLEARSRVKPLGAQA